MGRVRFACICYFALWMTSSWIAEVGAQTVIDWTGAGATARVPPVHGNGVADYNDPANWAGGNVPNSSSESARFATTNTPYTIYHVNLPDTIVPTTVSDLIATDNTIRLLATRSGARYSVSDDMLVQGGRIHLEVEMEGDSLVMTVADDLRIDSGGRVDVSQGATLSVSDLRLSGPSSTGFGILSVNGGAFELTGFVLTSIGQGGDGTLQFSNGATGSLKPALTLAPTGSSAGARGVLSVNSESVVTVGPLSVGAAAEPTASRVVGVHGEASLTIAGTLTVGAAPGGAQGTVTVSDGGRLVVHAPVTIRDTGRISAQLGTFGSEPPGIVEINAPVTIEAGGILSVAGGEIRTRGIQSAAGGISFVDGGLVVSQGTLVTPGVSQGVGLPDVFDIQGGTGPNQMVTLTLTDGATSDIPAQVRVGRAQRGTLVVESGSRLTSLTGRIGEQTSGSGAVIVRGQSTGGAPSEWDIDGTLVINIGSLLVADGARVSSTSAAIGQSNFSNARAILTGAGAEWQIDSDLRVGDLAAFSTQDPPGADSLLVEDFATVEVGGEISIGSSGAVTVNGGSLHVQSIDNSEGGSFQLVEGLLEIVSGVDVGTGTVFPASLAIAPSQRIVTGATTSVAEGRTLALTGGGLRTGGLSVDGQFQFTAGVLEFTGGPVSGLTRLDVPTGGTLRAVGSYAGIRLASSSGSVIEATGDLTLGDASHPAGFYANGDVSINDNTLTLLDGNGAVLDSGASVELGSTGAGVLAAASGLTLDFGGNIAGAGTVDTPNDPARPLINNGHIAGVSPAASITLGGFVKGVGTFDNVNFTGTLFPGLSPTILSVGSITLAPSSTLVMELGGTTPGEDYDQIRASGTLILGGTLEIVLTDNFVPSASDAFELISADSIVGTFENVVVSSVMGGGMFDVMYTPNGLLISEFIPPGVAGDYNNNGIVDAADFVVWRKNEGTTSILPNDPLGGTIGAAQYTQWRANFGRTTGAGATTGLSSTGVKATTAVPEPSASAILLSIGLIWIGFRRN